MKTKMYEDKNVCIQKCIYKKKHHLADMKIYTQIRNQAQNK